MNTQFKYHYTYKREGAVYTGTKYSWIPPKNKELVLVAIRAAFRGATITDICEYRKADANGITIPKPSRS